MAEYYEREELYKILENWRDAHADVDDAYGCGLLEDVMCEVNAQPAADVVPVVRCRDCKRSAWRQSPFGVRTFTCELLCADIKPDDFCSYGERKDGEG